MTSTNNLKNRKYSFRILEVLGFYPSGLTFSELYRRIPVSRPCLSSTLKFLTRGNYIRRNPSGSYEITLKGYQILSSFESLDEVPRWIVEFLVGMVERELKRPIKNRELRFKLEDFLESRVRSLIDYTAGYLNAKMESTDLLPHL